jgi:LuxR family maltose regulon positive regulatory protein
MQSATFVYTPAIREAFERRLRTTELRFVRPLSLATARWELGQSQPYAALRRAVEFTDWALASRIVRGHWNELVRSHGAQLRELFSGTPLGVLRRQPLITMLLALTYNRTGHHRLRALEYFALASYGSRTQRENAAPADRVVLRAIETASLRVSGKFDDALTAALDGRDILLSMSVEDRDDLGRVEPTLHNQFGTTLFYSGHTEEALDSFARSTAIGAAKGLKAGLQGMALSAGTLAVSGDLAASRSLSSEADQLEWPEGWITGYMGSFYQLAGAFHALENFDPDAAERHVRSIDAHRETIEHWPLFAHIDALVTLMRGDPASARIRLDAEITRQRRRRAVAPQTALRLAYTRSLVDLAAGNPAAAERALGKHQAPPGSLGRARISLARAQPEVALRHLLQFDGAGAADDSSSRLRGEALALRAGALASLGEDDRGRMALADALAFLSDRQQGLALALVPADALDALILLAEGDGVADPHSLLRRARSCAIIPSARAMPSLTPRELALAHALSHASSTGELAQLLSISPNTVKSQLRGLYRKLDVTSRSEATAALSVLGLGLGPGLSERPDDRAAQHRSEPFA